MAGLGPARGVYAPEIESISTIAFMSTMLTIVSQTMA